MASRYGKREKEEMGELADGKAKKLSLPADIAYWLSREYHSENASTFTGVKPHIAHGEVWLDTELGSDSILLYL